MSIDTILLLGLSGSLRRGSYNTAVLASLTERLPAWLTLALHPLDELPPYNQDLDTEDPPLPVLLLRTSIAASDGLVIATPEYNHGLPGVLKNALDWASRPAGSSCLKGKPVAILSASPASTGGVRAQSQLKATLDAVQAETLIWPEAVIGHIDCKVAGGRLVDSGALEFVTRMVVALGCGIEERRGQAARKAEVAA